MIFSYVKLMNYDICVSFNSIKPEGKESFLPAPQKIFSSPKMVKETLELLTYFYLKGLWKNSCLSTICDFSDIK